MKVLLTLITILAIVSCGNNQHLGEPDLTPPTVSLNLPAQVSPTDTFNFTMLACGVLAP